MFVTYSVFYRFFLIFALDKIRLGSIKLSKTPFSFLAVALAFHYLCIR